MIPLEADEIKIDLLDGRIIKRARTERAREAILDEAVFLKKLAGTGVAPEILYGGSDYSVQEYLGESEEITDEIKFRDGAIRLRWELWKAGIWHGDLTSKNIVVRNNTPKAVDFVESVWLRDGIVPKRSLTDGYWLYRYVGRHETTRVAQRWLAILGALGGLHPATVGTMRLVDFGCYMGYFCAMAAGEGMEAIGVDLNLESLRGAQRLWGDIPDTSFFCGDVVNVSVQADVALLLSVWPYLVQKYGWDVGISLLKRIHEDCGVLFFETQLSGDGPGPDRLHCDEDVANMLGKIGNPCPVISLPVEGRDATRTVWMLK